MGPRQTAAEKLRHSTEWRGSRLPAGRRGDQEHGRVASCNNVLLTQAGARAALHLEIGS